VAQGDIILEVTSQDDVEQFTMEMCEARFRLTKNTPPTMEPLQSALGFMVQGWQHNRSLRALTCLLLKLTSTNETVFQNYRLQHLLIQLTASCVR
jgi:hypothetical protein